MKNFVLILIIIILTSSCEENILNDKVSLYKNSFENKSEISNWEGAYYLSDDTPKNGGDSSLIVSGGCVIPHISFEYGPFSEETKISIGLYGKNIESGGSVSVKLKEDRSNYRNIHINNTDWTYYETDSLLICPANESIIVEMNCGGLISGVMIIDVFEIFSIID